MTWQVRGRLYLFQGFTLTRILHSIHLVSLVSNLSTGLSLQDTIDSSSNRCSPDRVHNPTLYQSRVRHGFRETLPRQTRDYTPRVIFLGDSTYRSHIKLESQARVGDVLHINDISEDRICGVHLDKAYQRPPP